ncbi:MAG: DUF1566 domain-containing protein [Nitrospirae bacterium]|nr:DUF1566 domain-containing protein [Nitrospirota bacterium]
MISNKSKINLPQTGQTTSYYCGDDGAYQAGAAWPTPRFIDNGDDTVTDNLTGLMWAEDAGTSTVGACTGGDMTWTNAFDYVACLNDANYLDHNDWRLPNINELESMVNVEESGNGKRLGNFGFTNVQENYWSSTTYASKEAYAWVVGIDNGCVSHSNKTESDNYFVGPSFGSLYNRSLLCPNYDIHYVWPVRGGQSGSLGNLAILATGQTTRYYRGDDGAIQSGTGWPNPRFIDNGDGTVTDNLTGLMWTNLMWTYDVNWKGNRTGNKTWTQALDYVASINTGSGTYGHTDWRLPNRKELRSLVDYSECNAALLQGTPLSIHSDEFYWSSTTCAFDTHKVWVIRLRDGYVSFLKYYPDLPGKAVYFWPVRGGQVGNLITR